MNTRGSSKPEEGVMKMELNSILNEQSLAMNYDFRSPTTKFLFSVGPNSQQGMYPCLQIQSPDQLIDTVDKDEISNWTNEVESLPHVEDIYPIIKNQLDELINPKNELDNLPDKDIFQKEDVDNLFENEEGSESNDKEIVNYFPSTYIFGYKEGISEQKVETVNKDSFHPTNVDSLEEDKRNETVGKDAEIESRFSLFSDLSLLNIGKSTEIIQENEVKLPKYYADLDPYVFSEIRKLFMKNQSDKKWFPLENSIEIGFLNSFELLAFLDLFSYDLEMEIYEIEEGTICNAEFLHDYLKAINSELIDNKSIGAFVTAIGKIKDKIFEFYFPQLFNWYNQFGKHLPTPKFYGYIGNIHHLQSLLNQHPFLTWIFYHYSLVNKPPFGSHVEFPLGMPGPMSISCQQTLSKWTYHANENNVQIKNNYNCINK